MYAVLALLSALAYGVSDFIGGLTSRRLSPWAVAFVSQLLAAATVGLAASFSDGAPTLADLAWGATSGVGSGVGTYFLYRGLSSGQMNVVAPLSAVGAAVLPVIAGIVIGEAPTGFAWLGVLLALPAIWLVSRGAAPTAAGASQGTGVAEGLLAGAGFGVLFIALGQVSPNGGLVPLVIGQCVSALILVVGMVATGASPETRSNGRALGWAALAGVAAGMAALLYQVAVRSGPVSVTAVLASLYPAVTVALAMIVLRERVRDRQLVGLALAIAAVILITVG